MLMDVWAHLRRKRNHIIVQSDRRRGGLKMSSILYLHQAYQTHTTQCQILLMFRCSSLCERPTTSPTKKPHSKCTPLKNTAPQNIWAPRRSYEVLHAAVTRRYVPILARAKLVNFDRPKQVEIDAPVHASGILGIARRRRFRRCPGRELGH